MQFIGFTVWATPCNPLFPKNEGGASHDHESPFQQKCGQIFSSRCGFDARRRNRLGRCPKRRAEIVEASTSDFTSVFNTVNWGVSSGPTWTAGTPSATGFTSGQGIQITTTSTGANATTVNSYTALSKVVVKYSTDASAGTGIITLSVGGTQFGSSFNVTSTGGTTLRTATFNDIASGQMKITVTCSANSIYIHSILINTQDTFTSVFNTASYGIESGPTWNVGTPGGSFVSGLGVGTAKSASSDATSVVKHSYVTQVIVRYCTGSTTVKGSFTISTVDGATTQFGSVFTVDATLGTTLRNAVITGTAATGNVKLAVSNATTGTAADVYVYSVSICTSTDFEISPTSIFNSASWGVSIGPNWNAGTPAPYGYSASYGVEVRNDTSNGANATTNSSFLDIEMMIVRYVPSVSGSATSGTIVLAVAGTNYGTITISESKSQAVTEATLIGAGVGQITITVNNTSSKSYYGIGVLSIRIITAPSYEHSLITQTDLSTSTSKTLSGVLWNTVVTGGTIDGFDATYNCGVQFSAGTTNARVRSEVFNAPNQGKYAIRRVAIQASIAVGGTGTIAVTVGGVSMGSSQSLSASNDGNHLCIFEVLTPLFGHLTVNLSTTSGYALYIKGFMVYCETNLNADAAGAFARSLEAYNTCTQYVAAWEALHSIYDGLSSASKTYLSSINLDDYVGETLTINVVTAMAKWTAISLKGGHGTPSAASAGDISHTDDSLPIVILISVIGLSTLMYFMLVSKKKRGQPS